jgi:hypothetical protein
MCAHAVPVAASMSAKPMPRAHVETDDAAFMALFMALEPSDKTLSFGTLPTHKTNRYAE